MTNIKPKLVGGVGEINFGKQYRQGNRIYDSNAIAMCIHAQPVGNAGGNSYLYLVEENTEKEDDNLTKLNEVKYEGKPFTYASLFSGIGGFEQALNKLGGTCVFASEIDKFAAQAYETLYDEKPAGDITKIEAKDIPDHDLLVGGFPCFAAGTLITTSDGVKPIEDVRKGDRVLTHTNSFQEVVVPMIKRKKGIYELKVQGSPVTLITEEHPVYVREMYREWNNDRRSYERKWSEPKWIEAKDLKKGVHFVGMSENIEVTNPHELTKEEAWLIGRYVADGYIRNNKRGDREDSYNNQVVYCVGKDKIDEFKEKVSEYYVGVTEERTVYKCRIINKRFMDLCLAAGRGSENKRVPGFILDLPKELLEEFLEGYLSGDGCYTNKGYQATSVSRELIYGLAQVVQKLYNTPYSITYTKRPETTVIEGRTVNQRDTWMLRFRKENRKQQDGVYIDGMLWMPIRSLEYDADFEDYVYNFEVENDNSYVANNLTVHNCQAFSVAGKREGFEDTRGTLFFDIARIAAEKQPRALLLENVKGLVNHDKGRTLDVLIETLNDIGYIVDFNVLNSKYFGVPQNRERIFIIAIRADLIDTEPFSEEATKGQTIVPKGKRRIGEWADVFNFDWPEQTEVTTRLRDILESEVDEKYYLSDDKTAKLVEQLESQEPSVTAEIKCYNPRNINTGTQTRMQDRVYDVDGNVVALTSFSDRLNVIEPQMLGLCDFKGNDAIRRVYSPTGVAPTLTTMQGGHQEPKIAEAQEIANGGNISYCIDANYAKGISPGSIGKGRRTHVEEVRPVLTPDRLDKRQNGRRFKDNGEESFTLTSQDRHGVALGNPPKYRIRKLTPRECWRLQNFPDEAFDKVKVAGLSDSQLYRQAGNAITVSVVQAIGERLIPLITD